MAKLLGEDSDDIIDTILTLKPPLGRLDFIKSPNGVYGVVDYAHTPDALENVLRTLREVAPDNAKIITVVGCGGDRDKTKRPVMGAITFELSDYTVFTSDNPRTEDPHKILSDMIKDLPQDDKYEVEEDREKAISLAVTRAQPGDIVLLAGKGHEDYQIVGNERLHFSDKEELERIFSQ